jgi:hypothetical protein
MPGATAGLSSSAEVALGERDLLPVATAGVPSSDTLEILK